MHTSSRESSRIARLKEIARSHALLFDLDDTLIISGELGWIAATPLLNAFLRSKNVSQQFSSKYLSEQCMGTTFDALLKELSSNYGFEITEEENDNLKQACEELVLAKLRTSAAPPARLLETLSALSEVKATMAVVSSSSNDWIATGLMAAGITSFFPKERHFSASSLNLPNKPSPVVYETATDVLRTQLPGQAMTPIAIEDSIAGVKSARRAGIPLVIGSVACFNPESHAKRTSLLLAAGAHKVIRSWSEFFDCIDSLTQTLDFRPDTPHFTAVSSPTKEPEELTSPAIPAHCGNIWMHNYELESSC